MDPIRSGQLSFGGPQRLQGHTPAPGITPADPAAVLAPAASVAGGVSELRTISARIADIERAGFRAMARRDQIDDTAKLLAELRAVVNRASAGEAEAQAQLAGTQARFDDIISQITLLEEGSPLRANGPLTPTQSPGVVATDVSPAIDKYSFGADLKPGEIVDVNVNVLASAQVAGFLLSFGGNNLNLGGATEQFIIRIGGILGKQELAFSSGTTLQDVAAAINSFTQSTGVDAHVSGTTGIRLSSTDYGATQFVSVQIVDDGAIGSSFRKGIYSLQQHDADNANHVRTSTFANADDPLKDIGQDVKATINGVAARANGREIRARLNGDVWVDLLLSDDRSLTGANALALGKIDALTLSRPVESPAIEPPSPARLDEVQARIDQLLEVEAQGAEARSEALSQLMKQMRGSVTAQTGASSSDFDAARAAAALRSGLLGQPAPTPTPPSGGIEPRRSVELLTDRESTS